MTASQKTVSLANAVAALDKKLADLGKKQGVAMKQQAQAFKAMNSAKTSSALGSKAQAYERVSKSLSKIQDEMSKVTKRREAKAAELAHAQTAQQDARKKELKSLADLEHRQRQERFAAEQAFQAELARLREGVGSSVVGGQANDALEATKSYDFFVSHASEDKRSFVEPLCDALVEAGCRIWYDAHSLRIGDSLRRSIEKGIVQSRFGIVVVSEAFLRKEWPARELDTLTAFEIDGKKKVLPIWHQVSKDLVAEKAPLLIDKLALRTSDHSIAELVQKLKELLE